MFRANQRHLQPALISSVSELPAKYQRRLAESWAGAFRQEFFLRLHEEPFAVLYATVDSRPNTPVNVLVGLDVLKAGFGWCDEELIDHFRFDLQVRYALGLDSLAEGDFELRTLYYFRSRVSQYNQAHGTNLLSAAFVDITDQQITAFKVRTGLQRMDSTQLAANILDMSRLQLLVEALQRLHRLLNQADQELHATLFAPYLESRSNQYVYRIKGPEATQKHLQLVGQALYQALEALQADYAGEAVYQTVVRLFAENFRVEAATAQAKANGEIGSGCLQSLDDQEASYRSKAGKPYKGYVANVTETCDPANELQLITNVQVAPNNVDDETLLVEAIPELKRRTDLETLHTDGGYTGPEADEVTREHGIEQIPTAIRGEPPASDKLSLADFEVTQDAQGQPTQLTCPQGQTVEIRPSQSGKGFTAHFATDTCETCPFNTAGRCRTKPGKRRRYYRLSFDQAQLDRARRRQRCKAAKHAPKNLRVAVEATVRSVKHPFPAGKLPVRGLFRVTCMAVASAAMTNIRRIRRHLISKSPAGRRLSYRFPLVGRRTHALPVARLLASLLAPRLRVLLHPYQPAFAC